MKKKNYQLSIWMNINWTPSIPNILSDVFSVLFPVPLFLFYFSLSLIQPMCMHTCNYKLRYYSCVCCCSFLSLTFLCRSIILSFLSSCVIRWNQFRLLVFHGRRVHQQIYFEIELPEITDIDKRLKNYFFFTIRHIFNSTPFNHNNDKYTKRVKQKEESKKKLERDGDWKENERETLC